MTDYVFLTLLMSGAFLLDTGNSRSDESQSLLFLYFLLLFLDEACLSEAGYYSILSSHLDLQILRCMAPLYLCLALRLRHR